MKPDLGDTDLLAKANDSKSGEVSGYQVGEGEVVSNC